MSVRHSPLHASDLSGAAVLNAAGAISRPPPRSMSAAIVLARAGRGASATPIPTPAGWDAGSGVQPSPTSDLSRLPLIRDGSRHASGLFCHAVRVRYHALSLWSASRPAPNLSRIVTSALSPTVGSRGCHAPAAVLIDVGGELRLHQQAECPLGFEATFPLRLGAVARPIPAPHPAPVTLGAEGKRHRGAEQPAAATAPHFGASPRPGPRPCRVPLGAVALMREIGRSRPPPRTPRLG